LVWFFALLNEWKLKMECVMLVIPLEGRSVECDTFLRVCCTINRLACGR